MRDTVLFIAETKRSERVNERLGRGFFIVSVATKVPVLPTFPRRADPSGRAHAHIGPGLKIMGLKA